MWNQPKSTILKCVKLHLNTASVRPFPFFKHFNQIFTQIYSHIFGFEVLVFDQVSILIEMDLAEWCHVRVFNFIT